MSPKAIPVYLENVSKWYGQVIGINRVSLEVGEGVTGLLGPNGSGKTTLLKLVTGLLRPSLGGVRVYGKRVWSSPRARSCIGYCPEIDAFHEEMSCRQFVESMARLSGLSSREAKRRTGHVLDEVGMAAGAHLRLRTCSRGMRQRVKLAQALVHDPPILVLDEPALGLDPPGRKHFLELVKRLGAEGKVILFSSHILHEVEKVTQRIVLLDRGNVLAAGTLEDIRALIGDQPLTVRLTSNQRAALAGELLARDLVVAVSLDTYGTKAPANTEGDCGDWSVRVRRARAFFREFPAVVVKVGARVEHLETVDASAEAVFDYLVGGDGRTDRLDG